MRFTLPTVERLVRLVLGLGLAAYAWLAPHKPNSIFVAIGLGVALTGLVGFCPACALAGRRLNPRP